MKKTILWLLAILLLLSGCSIASDTVTFESAPGDSSGAPTAQAVGEEPGTAPQEPPVLPVPLPEWYSENREGSLPYDKLFSENIRFAPNYWKITRENGVKFYTAAKSFKGNFLQLSQWMGEDIQQISLEHLPREAQPLGADGRNYWFYTPDRILAMNMATGETTDILAGKEILAAQFGSQDVLYYIDRKGDAATLHRLYLPTQWDDILFRDIPVSDYSFLYLWPVKGSLEKIHWYMINPEMSWILKRELNNTESIYRTGKFTCFWEEPIKSYTMLLGELMLEIQKKTGVSVYMYWTFDPADNTCKKMLGYPGKADGGTDYPVDFYSPEDPAPAEPRILAEPWKQLEGAKPARLLPEMPENVGLTAAGYGDPMLYRAEEDGVVLLSEQPLTGVYPVTGGYIGVTPEHAVVQLDEKGAQIAVLYQAGAKPMTSIMGSRMWIMDQALIVEIDLETMRSRACLAIEGGIEMYADTETQLYFAVCRGLHYRQYLFYPETGTLNPTHRI